MRAAGILSMSLEPTARASIQVPPDSCNHDPTLYRIFETSSTERIPVKSGDSVQTRSVPCWLGSQSLSPMRNSIHRPGCSENPEWLKKRALH